MAVRTTLVLLLLLVSAALPLDAATQVRVSSEGTLVPGRWVEAEWRELPAEVLEFELVFETDGVVSRIRLTPELKPQSRGRIRFVVPSTGARSARVALRGNNGRRAKNYATTALLAVSTSKRAVKLVARRGDWYDADAPRRAAESQLRSPSLSAAPPAFAAALLRDERLVLAEPLVSTRTHAAAAKSFDVATDRALDRTPEVVPQRK